MLHGLALGLGAVALERFNYHVAVDVELGVELLLGKQHPLHGALAKAPVLQQFVAEPLEQRPMADARAQHPHAQDHHLLTSLSLRSQAVSTRRIASGEAVAVWHYAAAFGEPVRCESLSRSSRRKILPMLLLGSGSLRNSMNLGLL